MRFLFFGRVTRKGGREIIISYSNALLKKGAMGLTRSAFGRFVSPCVWRKRCMKQGRCRWIDCPSKEHETFCEYICCEPKNNVKGRMEWNYATDLRTVWPSTPVCSKFIPAEPSAQTIIWSYRSNLNLFPSRQTTKHTLSYHLLVHVPTCSPPSRL